MTDPIWIILVNNRPSTDGYFLESELDTANSVMLKYTGTDVVELKKIKPNSFTDC